MCKRRILFPAVVWLSVCGAAFAQQAGLQEKLQHKQYAAVLAMADSLAPAGSASYATFFAFGQAAEGLLKYPEAYGYYQRCLEMDSTLSDTWSALARTAASMGRASEAETFFRKVLEADSLDFYANLQLARLYYQSGEYQKALEKYARLQAEDVENPVLWQAIGDCYTKQELISDAAIAYFKAFGYNPRHAGLAHALVNTLLRLGGDFIAEAVTVSDTALVYNPGHRQLLRSKGMALYMSRQYNVADTLFSRLLAEGDSSYLTLKYAGASKYNAGMYMASIEPLELAYEQDTTSAEVCLLLGSALGKTYDRQRAFTLLDQAEKSMQPNPFWLNQLSLFRAETHAKAGNRLEAGPLILRLLEKESRPVGYTLLPSAVIRRHLGKRLPDRRRAATRPVCVLSLHHALSRPGNTSEIIPGIPAKALPLALRRPLFPRSGRATFAGSRRNQVGPFAGRPSFASRPDRTTAGRITIRTNPDAFFVCMYRPKPLHLP